MKKITLFSLFFCFAITIMGCSNTKETSSSSKKPSNQENSITSSEEIIPKNEMSLYGINIGDSRNKLIDTLGVPINKEIKDDMLLYIYPSVSFYMKEDKIFALASADNEFATSKGIKIGDSISVVSNLYENSIVNELGAKVESDDAALLFLESNDLIDTIYVIDKNIMNSTDSDDSFSTLINLSLDKFTGTTNTGSPFNNHQTFADVLNFSYPDHFIWEDSELRNENMDDPFFKIWFLEEDNGGKTLNDIRTEALSNLEMEGESELVEEKMLTINGKDFFYTKEYSTFEFPCYILGLYTIYNGKQYILYGYVKETENYEDGLDLLQTIYQSIEFRY